jgi:hypothetical protein
MTAQAACEALAAAFAAQKPEYRSFFGVVTVEHKRATAFLWRNYFTGEWATLARVPEAETIPVAQALLAELAALRKPPVLRKAPQTVGPWRERSA